jgi:hypothetical protein
MFLFDTLHFDKEGQLSEESNRFLNETLNRNIK